MDDDHGDHDSPEWLAVEGAVVVDHDVGGVAAIMEVFSAPEVALVKLRE